MFQLGKMLNIGIDRSFLVLVNKLHTLRDVEHKFSKERYRQYKLYH